VSLCGALPRGQFGFCGCGTKTDSRTPQADVCEETFFVSKNAPIGRFLGLDQSCKLTQKTWPEISTSSDFGSNPRAACMFWRSGEWAIPGAQKFGMGIEDLNPDDRAAIDAMSLVLPQTASCFRNCS
jgi:hypothetical protein